MEENTQDVQTVPTSAGRPRFRHLMGIVNPIALVGALHQSNLDVNLREHITNALAEGANPSVGAPGGRHASRSAAAWYNGLFGRLKRRAIEVALRAPRGGAYQRRCPTAKAFRPTRTWIASRSAAAARHVESEYARLDKISAATLAEVSS